MMNKIVKYIMSIITVIVILTSGALAQGRLNVDMPMDRAALVYDVKSMEILYSQNADLKMYPASTTKLMTALTAIDHLNLDDWIKPGSEVMVISADSSKAGLTPGKLISARDLLAGLLLPSGNDAANVLAVYAARKASGDSDMEVSEALEYFSEMMNDKAKSLKLEGSNFVNPHGLHSDEHYTTAKDMLNIAKEFLKNEFLKELVSKSHYISNDGEWNFYNTNVYLHKKLDDIWYLYSSGENQDYNPYVTGIKTGFTSLAGRCIVFSAARGDKELIGIVLGSDMENVYDEGNLLMDAVFEDTDYIDSFESGEKVAEIEIKTGYFGKTQKSSLVNLKKKYYLLPKEDLEDVIFEFVIDEEILEESDGTYQVQTKIKPGDEVGRIKAVLNGENLFDAPLTLDAAFDEARKPPIIIIVLVSGIALVLVVAVSIRFIRMEKR